MDPAIAGMISGAALVIGILIGQAIEERDHKSKARARAAKSRALRKLKGQSPKENQ